MITCARLFTGQTSKAVLSQHVLWNQVVSIHLWILGSEGLPQPSIEASTGMSLTRLRKPQSRNWHSYMLVWFLNFFHHEKTPGGELGWGRRDWEKVKWKRTDPVHSLNPSVFNWGLWTLRACNNEFSGIRELLKLYKKLEKAIYVKFFGKN